VSGFAISHSRVERRRRRVRRREPAGRLPGSTASATPGARTQQHVYQILIGGVTNVLHRFEGRSSLRRDSARASRN